MKIDLKYITIKGFEMLSKFSKKEFLLAFYLQSSIGWGARLLLGGHRMGSGAAPVKGSSRKLLDDKFHALGEKIESNSTIWIQRSKTIFALFSENLVNKNTIKFILGGHISNPVFSKNWQLDSKISSTPLDNNTWLPHREILWRFFGI